MTAAAVVLTTLAPIAVMTVVVATTGSGNLSNDYIAYVGMVDRILSGVYPWSHYFHDTFLAGAHSMALPVLVRLGIVVATGWNLYAELYTVLALTALRLVLLHQAFTWGTRSRASLLLWPALAALLFSLSQVNVFTFGDAGLQIALNQLGLALGVWGLARFRRRPLGAVLMAAGGLIASYSGGAGLTAWPVFLGGLVLLGFRGAGPYAVWLLGAALASVPYVVFIVVAPTPASRPVVSLLSPRFLVQALGWPLADRINQNFVRNAMAWRHGIAGVALGAAGVVLLAAGRGLSRARRLRRAAPALMVIAYGVGTVWQTSVFRDAITPWYTATFMTFWVGLLGLAYTLWATRAGRRPDAPAAPSRLAALPSWWSAAVLAFLVVAFGSSNLTYADKAYYLFSRAPASASCLRNYRTAPTYCEEHVFQWGVGHAGILARLGEPLERHGLNVFAPRERWTLQGDFALETVRIEETPGVPDIVWSPDLGTRPLPYSHYEHLNVFLHSPNAIAWTIRLPAHPRRVAFHSATAISTSAPRDPGADGVTFEISVEEAGRSPEVVFRRHAAPDDRRWRPVRIDLRRYAGRTITLRLTSSPGANLSGDWAMYRFPYIDVDVAPGETPLPAAPAVAPPAATARDVRLDAAHGPASLDTCLADYSHLVVGMAASRDIDPRAFRVLLGVGGQPPGLAHSFQVPLQADEGLHDYAFDLKLLEFDQKVRLTAVRIDPPRRSGAAGSAVRIGDVRLVATGRPSACTR